MKVREGDEWKTGFNTPSGHYEYLVIPFGDLREFLNVFVFVYIDNILIFSPDMKTHVIHVHQVLQKLLDNQLYIKAEECDFHAEKVSFLGFIISASQFKWTRQRSVL